MESGCAEEVFWCAAQDKKEVVQFFTDLETAPVADPLPGRLPPTRQNHIHCENEVDFITAPVVGDFTDHDSVVDLNLFNNDGISEWDEQP